MKKLKALKVYEYQRCSTCKKALGFLDKRKVPYEAIAIVEQPPTPAELKKMLGFLGGNIRKLFNTSGIQYRELKLAEKLPAMTEGAALKLLASNGKLVKRPFVLGDDIGTVGFNETEWKKFT